MLKFRFLLCAIFAMTSVSLAPAQFDDTETKTGDAKDQGSREDDAWRAWLKKLGSGPVYRAEVLFRCDDRLFLAEALMSPDVPRPRMMGFGLNDKGEAIPPPDPGYQQVQDQVREVRSDKPDRYPLAWRFRYYGVSLRDGGIAHHSDVATRLKLPREVGAAAYTLHGGAFRVERLSPQQLAKAQPLRRDPEYFRERTAAIRREFLTTHRQDWTDSPNGTIEIARLFPEPKLIEPVRRMVVAWIDREPSEVAGKGWPGDASNALAHLGTAKDFAVFHRLVRRHPVYAHFAITPSLDLVKRVGGRDAGPLIADLLKLGEPFETGSDCAKLLRRLAPDVPAPTYGDYAVMSIAEKLGRKPSDFGMKLAPELLTVKANAHSEDWVFPNAAERKKGTAAALKWATEYRPTK